MAEVRETAGGQRGDENKPQHDRLRLCISFGQVQHLYAREHWRHDDSPEHLVPGFQDGLGHDREHTFAATLLEGRGKDLEAKPQYLVGAVSEVLRAGRGLYVGVLGNIIGGTGTGWILAYLQHDSGSERAPGLHDD